MTVEFRTDSKPEAPQVTTRYEKQELNLRIRTI